MYFYIYILYQKVFLITDPFTPELKFLSIFAITKEKRTVRQIPGCDIVSVFTL